MPKINSSILCNDDDSKTCETMKLLTIKNKLLKALLLNIFFYTKNFPIFLVLMCTLTHFQVTISSNICTTVRELLHILPYCSHYSAIYY